MSDTIYDPIASALGLRPILLEEDYPEQHFQFPVPSWNKGIDRSEEEKKQISEKMKQVCSDNDYWKKGVRAAANKCRNKKQSEEHIRKRAKGRSREVEINGVLYESGKEAAKALNVHPGLISEMVKENNGSRYGIIPRVKTGSNQYVKR